MNVWPPDDDPRMTPEDLRAKRVSQAFWMLIFWPSVAMMLAVMAAAWRKVLG